MKKIVIDIERVLAEKGVSKTTLCYWCRLQRTQLNNYCKNKVVRVDLHTLEKVCDYLECDVCDILKMVEAEEEEAGREKWTAVFCRITGCCRFYDCGYDLKWKK